MSLSGVMTSRQARSWQAGFTLIELMIAITLSLVVLVALSAMFVTGMRARDEIARTNQQIENGRYAMQVLADDLQQAGHMGKADLRTALNLGQPTVLDTQCAIGLNALMGAAPLYVEGDNNLATVPAACTTAANFKDETLSDFKAGTDLLVIRRVSGCAIGETGCTTVAGAPYFQASMCGETPAYLMSTNTATLTLRNRLAGGGGACATTLAERRRFITHIYFVANNNEAGDAIPTLKRAELDVDPDDNALKFIVVPLVEGIEDMQLEYVMDSNGNGEPDATSSSPAAVADWKNVVSVKIHLLARSTDKAHGHVDDKTYQLGSKQILPTDIPADEKAYKRHVFQTAVRLNTPAGLRQ